MAHLMTALEVVESEIKNRESRCAIVDEGHRDESTLHGTRDGYLKLVSVLLRFVLNFDESFKEDAHWSDEIKTAIHDLPHCGTWIVGMELHAEQRKYFERLSEIVDFHLPQDCKLLNDPQFGVDESTKEPHFP